MRLDGTEIGRLVIDFSQIESVSGCNRAAAAAIGGGQGIGEILGPPFSFAHELQRAHHRTDLMVEERSRIGVDFDEIADPGDSATVERLDWRSCLTGGGAKSREIMTADQ